MNDENVETALIAEQLRRFQDNLTARLELLEQRMAHNSALMSEQISSLRSALQDVKTDLADHEARIRSNTDSASGFRMLFGGAGLASFIALVKSFLP